MKLNRVAFYSVADRFADVRRGEDFRDMLRYDLAFVNPEEVERPEVGKTVRHPYRLLTIAAPKIGGYGGKLTIARWKSHGFDPRPYGGDRLEEMELSDKMRREGWVTYRHPADQMKGDDYRNLIAVSIDRFTFPGVKQIRDVTTELTRAAWLNMSPGGGEQIANWFDKGEWHVRIGVV